MEGDKDYQQTNTILFLGAGFSAPADVPMTYAFVDAYKEHLSNKDKTLYSESEKILKILTESEIRGKSKDKPPDIEFVYELLHRRLDYKNELILAFFEFFII